MDDQSKIMLVLLVLIIILGGIFGLKVLGIIKPAEKEIVNTTKIENKSEVDNNENHYQEHKEKKHDRLFMATDKEISKLRIYLIIMYVIEYLILGIAIYKIAKVNEIKNSWLAFIPFAQLLLEAKIGFGSIGIGIIYAIGTLLQQVWGNNILKIIVSIIGLIILYGIFSQISDKPNHKLGNLVAFELLATIIGIWLYVNTLSMFWLAFISMGSGIVGGLYFYYLSKKYETNTNY